MLGGISSIQHFPIYFELDKADQLYVEDQGTVGADLGTYLAIAVTEMWRDKKAPFAAGRHQL